MPTDDADFLRSLRQEIGAPSRPSRSTASGRDGNSSINTAGGRGESNMSAASRGTSRRAVAGYSDMASAGLLRDEEEGVDSDADDLAGQEYGFVMFDPVWGKPDYPPGHRTSACQVCGILCCPCLMGKDGCRGAKNKAVWRRIRRRSAIIISAIDIVMFIVSVIVNGGFQPMWGTRDSNPLLGPSPETVIVLGAKHVGLIQRGQVWRLLTPILLHGGVLHMVMNLLSQFRMGVFLEERWGTRNWLIIYWIGGLGGNMLSCAASPDKVGVGASGAIYAIMGGWMSHVLCTWDEEDEFDKCAQLTQVVGYTCMGMVMSLAPIVDWAAHVGGLVFGIMIGWTLFHKPSTESRNMLREPLRKKAVRLQGKLCMWTAGLLMLILTYWMFFISRSTLPLIVLAEESHP